MSSDAVARMGAALRDYIAGQEEDFTLRDYFAAKAMQAYLTAADTGWEWDEIAGASYKMADNMLKARKQP